MSIQKKQIDIHTEIYDLNLLLFYCFGPTIILICFMLLVSELLQSLPSITEHQRILFVQTLPMLFSFGCIPAVILKKYSKKSIMTIIYREKRKNGFRFISFLFLSFFIIYLIINIEDALLVYSLLLHFFIVALTEEFLMRGLITRQLELLLKNEQFATLISALIFAFIFHTTRNVISNFFVRFPFGLIMSWLYKRTGSLELPIVIHWIYNAVWTMIEVSV